MGSSVGLHRETALFYVITLNNSRSLFGFLTLILLRFVRLLQSPFSVISP